MITRRTALYVTGGTLLLAYLAAANSSPTQPSPPARDAAPRASARPPDAMAAEVRREAVKLHERLAVAPVPNLHARNPFGFATRPAVRAAAPVTATGAPATAAEAQPAIPPDPPLSLIGIAEDTAKGQTRRTAIISGSQDALYMVAQGDTVAGRYAVTAVSPDAVELKDLVTGGFRRLAMR